MQPEVIRKYKSRRHKEPSSKNQSSPREEPDEKFIAKKIRSQSMNPMSSVFPPFMLLPPPPTKMAERSWSDPTPDSHRAQDSSELSVHPYHLFSLERHLRADQPAAPVADAESITASPFKNVSGSFSMWRDLEPDEDKDEEKEQSKKVSSVDSPEDVKPQTEGSYSPPTQADVIVSVSKLSITKRDEEGVSGHEDASYGQLQTPGSSHLRDSKIKSKVKKKRKNKPPQLPQAAPPPPVRPGLG